MQILILTSSRKGTASFCLPLIVESTGCTVAMVIYNMETAKKNMAFYKKKLKKMFKIGLWGTLNGIRMRKWYTDDVKSLGETEDIETLCKKFEIPFHITHGINSDNSMLLFKKANADLGLSLGNSYISKKIFSIPRYGMINIHGELLPQFRNAQSVIWQLYENSSVTGYTIHEVNSKIDDGAILKTEKVPIVFRETLAETVSYSCLEILKSASGGLVEVLNNYSEYSSNKQSQKGGKSYTTPNAREFKRIKDNFKKLRDGIRK